MIGTVRNVTGGATAGPNPATAELLDVGAVAGLLNCSPRHVYRLADTNRMPRPFKLGALVRWQRTALLNWIDAGCPAQGKGGQQQ